MNEFIFEYYILERYHDDDNMTTIGWEKFEEKIN